MDPVTILMGAAAALSALSFAVPSSNPGPFRYRRVMVWTDGWVATELCSRASLSTACGALDIPLHLRWEAALETGMRKFVLVTREGGPATGAVLCLFDRMGAAWQLAQVFGVGMNRTMLPDQDQHVAELSESMARDLGKEVADRARQIQDPAARYDFLRAVVRQPVLAAHVVPEREFADVVVETVEAVHPERLALLSQDHRAFEPISSDLVVRRLPLSTSTVLAHR